MSQPSTVISRLNSPPISTRPASPRIPRGPAIPHDRPRHRAAYPHPLPQANPCTMIRRRAAAARIATKIGNHTFRPTGISAYLKNGGTLQ